MDTSYRWAFRIINAVTIGFALAGILQSATIALCTLAGCVLAFGVIAFLRNRRTV